ncbi:MAG: hypothetical protein SH856_02165 [Flavobacteriales bacterium]|nr:hypothetical protein [Flavobacteriales bacterium]
MTLQIDDHKPISTLQKDFTAMLPFLKIEFFSQSHSSIKGSAKKQMIDPRTLLGSIRNQHSEGDLFIAEDMTVTELERLLERSYDLHVQIFRKSGKLWLETTATDNWTLDYQNVQGAELQHKDLGIQRDENDYHEQE